jgi:hypothetical protein
VEGWLLVSCHGFALALDTRQHPLDPLSQNQRFKNSWKVDHFKVADALKKVRAARRRWRIFRQTVTSAAVTAAVCAGAWAALRAVAPVRAAQLSAALRAALRRRGVRLDRTRSD